jgi:hypothetical protein
MNIEQILDIIDRPTAWAFICKTHLGNVVKCPICGAIVTGTKALASFAAMNRTYCKSHGSTFQAKSAVAQLSGTEWTPEDYVKLRLLNLVPLPPAEIAKILRKSQPCVRDMLNRCTTLEGLLQPDPSFLACRLTDKG